MQAARMAAGRFFSVKDDDPMIRSDRGMIRPGWGNWLVVSKSMG
jgi:hypothetical protein